MNWFKLISDFFAKLFSEVLINVLESPAQITEVIYIEGTLDVNGTDPDVLIDQYKWMYHRDEGED